MTSILFFCAGFLLGAFLLFFLLKIKFQKQFFDFMQSKNSETIILTKQYVELEKEKALFADRNQTLQKQLEELTGEMQQLRTQNLVQGQQLARAEGRFCQPPGKTGNAAKRDGSASAKIHP